MAFIFLIENLPPSSLLYSSFTADFSYPTNIDKYWTYKECMWMVGTVILATFQYGNPTQVYEQQQTLLFRFTRVFSNLMNYFLSSFKLF